MINNLCHRLFRAIIALVVGLLISTGAQSAGASEVGPGDFMVLSNPTTGEELAAWCENDRVTSIAVLSDRESYTVGTPMNTECSSDAFPGFDEVVGIDPRNGHWVVAPVDPDNPETMYAYGCADGGLVFALKYAGEPLQLYWRDGACLPGAVPG